MMMVERFLISPEGFYRMGEHYNFQAPAEIQIFGPEIVYSSLLSKDIDVGVGYGTDALIKEHGFVVLEDNKNFLAVYNPAPVLKTELLNKYPKLEKLLNQLSALLTHDTVLALNHAVDVDKKSINNVSTKFLQENDLL